MVISEATLNEIIDRFVKEVSLGRTLDWYLIKLSSAVSSIEELARYQSISARVLIQRFLSNERVRTALQSIACYSEEVREAIVSSPRFRNLRPYIDDIVEVLNSIPCTSAELALIREPTWRIERFERLRGVRSRKVKRRINFVKFSEFIAIALSIASIIVFIAAILF